MKRFALLCCALWLLGGCAEEQPASDAPADASADSLAVKMPELREELLAMEAADQQVREPMQQPGFDFQNMPPEIAAAMDSVDSVNQSRLRAIIDEQGWPTAAMVGRDGIAAIFLIIQHAELPFQQEALPHVRQWYEEGAIHGQSVALMTDRVLLKEGEPQLYGTQSEIIDGEVIVLPLADSARVDKRRAELGLPPLEDYLVLVREAYGLAPKQP